VRLGGNMNEGYYVSPTVFEGDNRMRIFQEEIFGPVLSVTKFNDFDDAMRIANDTLYGLGAGVWTRSTHTAQKAARTILAGRVPRARTRARQPGHHGEPTEHPIPADSAFETRRGALSVLGIRGRYAVRPEGRACW